MIIAKNDQRTNPYPHCCQRQRRKRYKRSPEPTTSPAEPIPRSQHRQICTCLPRAKGPLDRRSKRLSFPHFFLRRKKCGRRRLAPAGAKPSPAKRKAQKKRLRKQSLFYMLFSRSHGLDNVHDLRADALLGLVGGSADVGRAGHHGMAVQRLVGGGLVGVHIQTGGAHLAGL